MRPRCVPLHLHSKQFSTTWTSLYRKQRCFHTRDGPVVTGRFVRLRFGDGPLSGLSTGWSLVSRLPPVYRRPPSRRAAGRCALCGDAGFRPAGGQLLVVLVIKIQQLSVTAAQTETKLWGQTWVFKPSLKPFLRDWLTENKAGNRSTLSPDLHTTAPGGRLDLRSDLDTNKSEKNIISLRRSIQHIINIHWRPLLEISAFMTAVM